MFKKLVLMCGLVFIALPLNSVFAAEVKLSLGNDFINNGSTLNLSGKNFEHAFDSNTAIDKKSFVQLSNGNSDNISLKFVEPTTITSFLISPQVQILQDWTCDLIFITVVEICC